MTSAAESFKTTTTPKREPQHNRPNRFASELFADKACAAVRLGLGLHVT